MTARNILFLLSCGGAILLIVDLYGSDLSVFTKGYFTLCTVVAMIIAFDVLNEFCE